MTVGVLCAPLPVHGGIDRTAAVRQGLQLPSIYHFKNFPGSNVRHRPPAVGQLHEEQFGLQFEVWIEVRVWNSPASPRYSVTLCYQDVRNANAPTDRAQVEIAGGKLHPAAAKTRCLCGRPACKSATIAPRG